ALKATRHAQERCLDAPSFACENPRQPMKDDDNEQERNLFHFLMENIPDRIYFKDRESRFICVNAAMARLFHLKNTDEAVGKIDFDFFPQADAQQMYEDEQRVVKTGEAIFGKVEKKILPD